MIVCRIAGRDWKGGHRFTGREGRSELSRRWQSPTTGQQIPHLPDAKSRAATTSALFKVVGRPFAAMPDNWFVITVQLCLTNGGVMELCVGPCLSSSF